MASKRFVPAPWSGLPKPDIATSTGFTTLGDFAPVTLALDGAKIPVRTELQGWRGPAAGTLTTVGAFQIVARALGEEAEQAAALESLRIPDLSWSSNRPVRWASTLPESAIPAVEPQVVIARAILERIPWATLGSDAARDQALSLVNTRLAQSAFPSEIDPSPVADADSLLILSALFVHPAARRQQLGLSLLWGAIAGFGFGPNDAVIADAWPIGTPWKQWDVPLVPETPEAAVRARATVKSLNTYYAGLGLRPFRLRRSDAMPVLYGRQIRGL